MTNDERVVEILEKIESLEKEIFSLRKMVKAPDLQLSVYQYVFNLPVSRVCSYDDHFKKKGINFIGDLVQAKIKDIKAMYGRLDSLRKTLHVNFYHSYGISLDLGMAKDSQIQIWNDNKRKERIRKEQEND